MKLQDVFKGLRRVVVYSPLLALQVGDIKATIFLCQLIFHIDPHSDPKTWIEGLDYNRIHYETGLSRSEWERARAILKDKTYLEEELYGSPPRLRYRINLQKVREECESASDLTFPQADKNSYAENSRFNQQQSHDLKRGKATKRSVANSLDHLCKNNQKDEEETREDINSSTYSSISCNRSTDPHASSDEATAIVLYSQAGASSRSGKIALRRYGPISPDDPVLLAVLRVCKISPELASKRLINESVQAVLKLEAADISCDQLTEFERLWYAHDWRGQRGQAPTPAQIGDSYFEITQRKETHNERIITPPRTPAWETKAQRRSRQFAEDLASLGLGDG